MLTNEQVLSLATNILCLDDFVLKTLGNTTGIVWLENFINDLTNADLKLIVLMIYTGDIIENIDTADYQVLDDMEREDALDDYIDDYYLDVVLSDVPKYLHCYLDEEMFKEDYMNTLDPGVLSSNGIESEVTIFDETFYIYTV